MKKFIAVVVSLGALGAIFFSGAGSQSGALDVPATEDSQNVVPELPAPETMAVAPIVCRSGDEDAIRYVAKPHDYFKEQSISFYKVLYDDGEAPTFILYDKARLARYSPAFQHFLLRSACNAARDQHGGDRFTLREDTIQEYQLAHECEAVKYLRRVFRYGSIEISQIQRQIIEAALPGTPEDILRRRIDNSQYCYQNL